MHEPPYWIPGAWLHHTCRRTPIASRGGSLKAADMSLKQHSHSGSCTLPVQFHHHAPRRGFGLRKLMCFHIAVVALLQCFHGRPVHLAVVVTPRGCGGRLLPGRSDDEGVREDFLRRDPLRPVHRQHGFHELDALLALRDVGVFIVLQKKLS